MIRSLTLIPFWFNVDILGIFEDASLKFLSNPFSEWINKATSNYIQTGWSYYGFNNLDGYGYLWWIPNEGYLAYGYGGQFIAVFPSRDLVVGIHSETFSETSYQIEILNIIYDQIAPLFNRSN